MSHKEFVTIAHVRVKDRAYNAQVSLNLLTHCLHVFKYSEHTGVCVYDVFDDHSLVEAFLADQLPETKPKHY